jgi:flagellar FliL protein
MAEAAARQDSSPNRESDSSGTPKRRKDYIGLLLLVLAILNGAALLGLAFLMQKMWLRIQDVQELAKKPVKVEEETVSPAGKELQPATLGVLYPLEGFLVTINSDDGQKFLQLRLEMELSDPSLEDEISRKKPALRDAIIVLLTSRNFKQLREPNALKSLRNDIVAAVNRLLTSGKVKSVYFTQFHFN